MEFWIMFVLFFVLLGLEEYKLYLVEKKCQKCFIDAMLKAAGMSMGFSMMKMLLPNIFHAKKGDKD